MIKNCSKICSAILQVMKENVSLLSWKRKQLWRKGSQLGLETIVDGVVKDGVWDVYSILTLEGISVKIN
ncbi:acetyl-CoA C-acetyltransferase [Trifolium repens]|nr:acetyl-CoA C-acetyltransferase [Trifolium repens]